jgi:hypothetical protein
VAASGVYVVGDVVIHGWLFLRAAVSSRQQQLQRSRR